MNDLGGIAGMRSVGRPRGVKNRRTVEVEKWMKPLLPGAKRRLKELVSSTDDSVSLKASLAVISYVYGRAIARQELTGADGERFMAPSRIERVILDPVPRTPDGKLAALVNGSGQPATPAEEGADND